MWGTHMPAQSVCRQHSHGVVAAAEWLREWLNPSTHTLTHNTHTLKKHTHTHRFSLFPPSGGLLSTPPVMLPQTPLFLSPPPLSLSLSLFLSLSLPASPSISLYFSLSKKHTHTQRHARTQVRMYMHAQAHTCMHTLRQKKNVCFLLLFHFSQNGFRSAPK